jgi:hypothetical protein
MVESIMAQRNQALSAAYTFIGDKVKAYQGTNLSCPSTAEFFKGFQKPNIKNYPSTESSRGSCDSMVLGSLLKNLAKLGLWPYPSAPYGHFTIEGLYHPVNRLELVSLCDQFKPPELEFRYLLPRADCHGLRNALSTEVTTLRESVSGLDIQDFRKDS